MRYAIFWVWAGLTLLAGCMEVQTALSPPRSGQDEVDFGPVVNEHTQFFGRGEDGTEPDDGAAEGDSGSGADGETPDPGDDPDTGVDDGDGTDGGTDEPGDDIDEPGDGVDPGDGTDSGDGVDPDVPEEPDDTEEPDDMGSDGIPELPEGLQELTLPSGLRYIIVDPGSGDIAITGDEIEAHYTGWLEDGTKFDSSVDRGAPFEFTLGVGQVIAGWDEGISGMTEGERRRLIIPPDLGYGAGGSPPTIPGGATLIFDVELVSVNR